VVVVVMSSSAVLSAPLIEERSEAQRAVVNAVAERLLQTPLQLRRRLKLIWQHAYRGDVVNGGPCSTTD